MLASTYSFTSAGFRKPVHTARRSGRNLSGDDPLSKSTRAEISILMCEQKLYQVWFSFLRKRYPVWCVHNLAPEQALFVAFFRGARASSRRAWSDSRPHRAFFAQKNKKIMLVLYTTEHAALSQNVGCLW